MHLKSFEKAFLWAGNAWNYSGDWLNLRRWLIDRGQRDSLWITCSFLSVEMNYYVCLEIWISFCQRLCSHIVDHFTCLEFTTIKMKCKKEINKLFIEQECYWSTNKMYTFILIHNYRYKSHPTFFENLYFMILYGHENKNKQNMHTTILGTN